MGRNNRDGSDDEEGVGGIEVKVIGEIAFEKDNKLGKIRVIKEECSGSLYYELTWNFTVYRFTKKDIQENPPGITFKDHFFGLSQEAYLNLMSV